MSDGVLTSPATSTIASSVSSRPDAEDRIGMSMAEDATREAAELDESTGSDDVVDSRNVMDDNEGFEIMETEHEKEARLKRKAAADALAFSNMFAPVPAAAGLASPRRSRGKRGRLFNLRGPRLLA